MAVIEQIQTVGAPKTNRTSDLPLRRGLLYPLSYRGAKASYFSHLPCSHASPVGLFLQRVALFIQAKLTEQGFLIQMEKVADTGKVIR